MKTNPTARRIMKIHLVLIWVALVTIAGLEVTMGHTLASRIGQTYGTQTPGSVFGAPSISFGDMMCAVGR